MVAARAARGSCALALALLLGACATDPDSPSIAYREAESVDSLVVPPDLTKPSSPGALNVASADDQDARSRVLPQFEGVRFVRAGTQAWLELENADPEAVWPQVERFVRAQGLEIAEAEPAIGIIETEWAERYDGPRAGGLTGLFRSVFGGGGDPIFDRYQFALERIDGGGTRVLVAHRSAQETAREAARSGPVATAGSRRDFGWRRTAGDPAVRAEMMKRLLVHLGMGEDRAQGIVAEGRGAVVQGPVPQYFESEWGRAWVVVDDRGVRRVFARVESALEDIDAEIAASDFDQRRLRIGWAPPDAGDAESDPQTLTVFVRADDGATRITAGDAESDERSGDIHKALLRELTAAMGGDPGEVQQPEEAAPQREPGRPRSIMSPRRD